MLLTRIRRPPRADAARPDLRRRLTRLRWSRWPRRLLALALLLAALFVLERRSEGSTMSGSEPTPTAAVVVAARDLPAGHALTGADLAIARLPEAAVPAGASRAGDEPVGRVTSGPLRAGEPVTDVATIGPGYLAALPERTTAVPLRLTDPGVGRLLRPGDRIDLYAGPRGAPPTLVVAGALVLTVEASDQDATAAEVGPLLMVAAPTAQAVELAGSVVDAVVTATLTPP